MPGEPGCLANFFGDVFYSGFHRFVANPPFFVLTGTFFS
jgi:hypothetical protein